MIDNLQTRVKAAPPKRRPSADVLGSAPQASAAPSDRGALFSEIYGARAETWDRPDVHYNWPDLSERTCILQRVVSGSCLYEDQRGRRSVAAGEVMLYTAGEQKIWVPSERVEPCRFESVAFSSSATILPIFDHLRHRYGPVLVMRPQGLASAILNRILQRFSNDNFNRFFHPSVVLYRLLAILDQEQTTASSDKDPIEFGYYYMRHNFMHPINVKYVAHRAGLSREHFITQFTKRFGFSPGNFLKELRLEAANDLISTAECDIHEVAALCGFGSSTAFCRAFRRKFGVSPGSQRQDH